MTQAEHVGQIVPRIGDQRHRAGDDAVGRLDDHEGQVQRNADGEGAAEVGRGVPMPVPVMMVVVVVVVMVMMAAGTWAIPNASQAGRKQAKCQGACKPGSVAPTVSHEWTVSPLAAIPLGGPLPERSSNQPGLLARNRPAHCWARSPYSILLRVGFAVPLPLPVARCALAAPFHPCRLGPKTGAAVCSLWHFPLIGCPTRRALPATLVSWSPGLSSAS